MKPIEKYIPQYNANISLGARYNPKIAVLNNPNDKLKRANVTLIILLLFLQYTNTARNRFPAAAIRGNNECIVFIELKYNPNIKKTNSNVYIIIPINLLIIPLISFQLLFNVMFLFIFEIISFILL
jgi:hypothetical protein